MEGIQEMLDAWRQEAKHVRDHYTLEAVSRTFERCANDLERYYLRVITQTATLKEAADLSGYSYSHLRRMMDGGEIENVGGPGKPRLRVRDLPVRAGNKVAVHEIAPAPPIQGEDPEVARMRRLAWEEGL